MEITQAEWTRFKNMLSAINTRAVDDMMDWLESKGGIANVSFQEMSSYGYALATKYGEASASLSAQMYDEVAAASGMTLPAAEVADTVSYTEIAKAITKVAAQTQSAQRVSDVVGRYTKRTGADTMLKNAERDGAQFAWVPAGDSCAFCIALASRGWQFISKKSFKNGHAEHIHSNCDCTYAVRFDKKTNVAGYDPQVYKDMYYGAEGNTPQEKINSMRRIQYQNKKNLVSEGINDKIKQEVKTIEKTRFYVPKDVGAAFKKFYVKEPKYLRGGTIYIQPGTEVTGVKVILQGNAIRDVNYLIEKYPLPNGEKTKIDDWYKVRGRAHVTDGKSYNEIREVHWYQCKNIGKVDFKFPSNEDQR